MKESAKLIKPEDYNGDDYGERAMLQLAGTAIAYGFHGLSGFSRILKPDFLLLLLSVSPRQSDFILTVPLSPLPSG